MGRKNRSDAKRAEIIKHVYDVIAESGIEGATLSRIAKHMGIHKSLLTYYFHTKEEMIIALVDFITETYESLFLDKISHISDTRQRLETALDIVFSRQWDKVINARVFYSCFYLTLMNETIRLRFHKMYDRFKDVLKQELTIGRDQGIIDIEDPEQSAVFIVSLSEGYDCYWIISGDDKDTDRYGRHCKEQVKTLFKMK
jgi:AcrR family transcriptional regulator